MTRTPFELAREASIINSLAQELRREAERQERREPFARATVRLFALAEELDADAQALAENREVIL